MMFTYIDGHLCLNLEMLFEDLRPDTTRRFKNGWMLMKHQDKGRLLHRSIPIYLFNLFIQELNYTGIERLMKHQDKI
jgi:hypothetical protein